MKKTSLILLSMLLFSSVLNAQESIMFDKQYLFDNQGSYIRDVKQTADSGFICAGGIGFSMYDDRYLLFKTDSAGNLEWYKYSDSSAVHSTLWAVDLTKTGGYDNSSLFDANINSFDYNDVSRHYYGTFTTRAQECPSNLSSGLIIIITPIRNSLDDKEAEQDSLETVYNTLLADVNELELVIAAQTVTEGNQQAVHNSLMEVSPNLTDTIFLTQSLDLPARIPSLSETLRRNFSHHRFFFASTRLRHYASSFFCSNPV